MGNTHEGVSVTDIREYVDKCLFCPAKVRMSYSQSDDMPPYPVQHVLDAEKVECVADGVIKEVYTLHKCRRENQMGKMKAIFTDISERNRLNELAKQDRRKAKEAKHEQDTKRSKEQRTDR